MDSQHRELKLRATFEDIEGKRKNQIILRRNCWRLITSIVLLGLTSYLVSMFGQKVVAITSFTVSRLQEMALPSSQVTKQSEANSNSEKKKKIASTKTARAKRHHLH